MNDTDGTNEISNVFDSLRPRLHGIAYRMLGSTEEAEDVVQDAWLRSRSIARWVTVDTSHASSLSMAPFA